MVSVGGLRTSITIEARSQRLTDITIASKRFMPDPGRKPATRDVFPAGRVSGQGLTLRSRCLAPHQCRLIFEKSRAKEAATARLHPVAFEHLLAGRTQACSLGHETILDRSIIAEILSAETLGIARAGG